MRAFFVALWRGLDGLRKFLHLLLLLVIFGFVVGALRTRLPVIPEQAALVIRPEGRIVEQLSGDPLQRALERAGGTLRGETLLWDLVDAVRAARDDNRIQAVVVELDLLVSAGQPTLLELANELDAFRASGKRVIAHATAYSQGPYFLASHADEVYVDPLGFVLIDGYDRYVNYYKDVLDKVGVDINVFRVGTFKSAVEPFTRRDMSPEDREASLGYLNELWDGYKSQVEAARKLPAGTVDEYVRTLSERMSAAKGEGAKVALEAGLVTGIRTRQELERELADLVGIDPEYDSYRQVDPGSFLTIVHAERRIRGQGKPTVGVVVASGEMLDGEQPPGTVGGDTAAQLIREARLDDGIKALVLRIDSPGGSMIASEQIHREIEALKAEGKPFVVSMGDVAASGGYYIAAGADEIWAQPTTITGSIGIFGMIPTIHRTLDKVGVGVDGVGTTTWAGQMRLDRPLGKDATTFVQTSIEHGYETFLERVAEGRGKTRDEIDRIGQGRVWSGRQAKELGLVDHLGGFDDAISAAAARAKLGEDDYEVVFLDPSLSWAQELAMRLRGDLMAALLKVNPDALPGAGLMRMARQFDPVTEELERWMRLASQSQRLQMQAYCLCTVP